MAETRVAWFRLRGGQAGPHRAALDRALDGVELGGIELVTAEMARSAAELADSARRVQDPRLWLAATLRLEKLTARLPIGVSGERGDVAGGADNEPDEMALVLGAGASLGDSAES